MEATSVSLLCYATQMILVGLMLYSNSFFIFFILSFLTWANHPKLTVILANSETPEGSVLGWSAIHCFSLTFNL